MQPPEWANTICSNFPKSPSGLPRYRVVWAPDRTEKCFGREVKAYPQIGDFWILEVLVPFEKFGPWNETAFGPKPIDGEYCHSHTIRWSEDGKTWQAMSLDDFGAESLRLLVQCVEASKAIQAWQMGNHRDAMLAAEEKEASRIYSDVYDEASGVGLIGGPLGENMTNLNPAKRRSDDTRIVTLDDLPAAEQEKYRCRPGAVKQLG